MEASMEKAPIHTNWRIGKFEKEFIGLHGAVTKNTPARRPEVASKQRRTGATSGYPPVHLTQGRAGMSGLP